MIYGTRNWRLKYKNRKDGQTEATTRSIWATKKECSYSQAMSQACTQECWTISGGGGLCAQQLNVLWHNECMLAGCMHRGMST